MFEDRNYREWSVWKRNAPLDVNFSLFVEEMTGRAFWLKNEIGLFLTSRLCT